MGGSLEYVGAVDAAVVVVVVVVVADDDVVEEGVVEEEEEEDADMRMASAMATAMVAGKLGASTGDEINFVHSLMDQFLRTSVVEEERETDGRDTDLSKRQEEDEVSQLPSDLPGAMLSSSDEEEINSSSAFTTGPSDLPAVTDPYILHLLREAERKRADDAASGSFPAQEEQVAARVFDVPFSSSVPMMVRHLLFFIISYYYLRWSDTELKSHLFFSSFFFRLIYILFLFLF